MIVTKDQMDKLILEVNQSYARHERMIEELKKQVEELQEKRRPGRPPKEEAA